MGWTGQFGLDGLALADDPSFLAGLLGLANLYDWCDLPIN
jgi:hypothetical protein